MRQVLIAVGTLGGGTMLAFALAAIAFFADPVGRVVPGGTMAWPMPAVKGPPVAEPAILVDPGMAVPAPAAADGLILRGGGVAPAVPADVEKALEKELAAPDD